MRLIRFTLAACLVLMSAAVMAEEPIPISDLHVNDPLGFALMLDQIVTIQGVVTVPSGVFNSSRTDVYIQDDTGGMNLFSFNPIATYNTGDEVKVTGTVLQFNGLTEVEPISYELIATGQPEPQPLVLTCADLRDSYNFDDNTEPNEARLVRLNGVTWDSGNFALMDATGTAMMYITGATGIPAPEGEFNVVGVVKQYDQAGEEGPFFLGYEVLPRYISDITYGSGPQFVSFPVQTDVAMGSATIQWTTDIDCETVLEYGTTTTFEMEPIRLGDSTTNHEVVLTDLTSATVYYCRAVAGDGTESINSPSITVIGPSENSSGQIDVFFSKSVDTAYSTGVDAVSTNLAQRFIELINAATTSIDFCFANFTDDDVADALISAHEREVDVQVIYETFDPVINRLIVAGIEVATDPDEVHENTHNKFAVFDARDGDETDDVVWTGSWNATFNGTNFNAENAVVIRDAALATAYILEFDEMWGGTFSNFKTDNTPHLFLIGGRRVEQYMSPSDGLPEALTKLIGTADTDLLFAIYSFTDTPITAALTNRFNAGVAVRGVFDAEGAAYELSQYQPLADLGADVVLDNVEQGGADQQMHHKYLLTDPLFGGSDPTVVTGSYNWTYTAATYKDENIVIIHDATITNIFFQEWMARYHEGGGTWDYEIPEELAAQFSWNPSSPVVGALLAFTDDSTGAPTGWNWDFGDGVGASTEQNPTYTYNAVGIYNVTLEVTDGVDTASVSHHVTVSEVSPEGASVYFAAGAAAAGAGGSYWSTDAEINNRGNSMMTYSIRLLKRGEDNSVPTEVGPFTLGAGMSTRFTNVFGDLFDFEGAGAFAFVIDKVDDALLTSRTFNSFDDGDLAGTFGQGIPALTDADMIAANTKARLIGLSADDNFRTNIGFLNGSDANIRIFVEFFLADGTSLGQAFQDLAPYSNTQWNNAFNKVTTDAVADGYVDVWTETGMFTVYASVVGNDDFNDPTTVVPRDLPPPGAPVYFPAGAAAAGAGGSYWSTDAEINNGGASPMTYSLRLLKRGEDNSVPMEVGPFTLDAGMSARYTNVFGDHFAFEGAGAFAFISDSIENALLTSRTFNSFDDGNLAGTFGQGIPAITDNDMIGANTRVRLIGLSADDNFRTNIGFLNGSDANIRIFTEFFLADGTSLGQAFQDLAPYSNTQWNNAFNKVTTDAVADGYVDVWTEAGRFTVYASVVGNDDFNDPTTVLPQ